MKDHLSVCVGRWEGGYVNCGSCTLPLRATELVEHLEECSKAQQWEEDEKGLICCRFCKKECGKASTPEELGKHEEDCAKQDTGEIQYYQCLACKMMTGNKMALLAHDKDCVVLLRGRNNAWGQMADKTEVEVCSGCGELHLSINKEGEERSICRRPRVSKPWQRWEKRLVIEAAEMNFNGEAIATVSDLLFCVLDDGSHCKVLPHRSVREIEIWYAFYRLGLGRTLENV